MELSIVIVNYNTKKLTLDCIDSILEFAPKFQFEVIVVDNGSTDGSIEELRKSKKIILVENEENLGFAKANNQGIRAAKGEYVLLLNSDTKVTKDSIEKLVEFAKETGDAGAVVSRLLNPDGSTQSSVFRFPTIGRAIQQYWFGQKGLLDKYAPNSDNPQRVDVAVMAAFLITPKALKKVGLLNEKYFMFFEDFDYCREIKEKGLSVYYLPESQVYHYHGASGKNITSSENQWRRLVPSSKIYHGLLKHYILFFISWTHDKVNRLLNNK